ncbi:ABC transporter permease [Rhodovastum atsumiense]|uniref:ABC transporter permease n=1 Tax=Rhodovastum atsumiense TaxID=504468 RepID=A0A5M6IV53_9PROT|nr:ABC transporter permease [Rhodovastum atsumiense]KAA5612186.1 ABC transporter permease [Rhodovastum atsumiense]CAH2603860.1 ABC transporter permease [Rhodovastum atsumiense]
MLILRLALADAWHEWRLSACAALTVAAVVAPLLLLLGLKTGVVDHLMTALRSDPQSRQLALRGHGSFPPAWFEALRARPDVAFVAPRLRQLAQPVDVARPEDPVTGLNADLWVSAAGDPLLGPAATAIGPASVVLSARLARQGRFAVGDRLVVWALRRGPEGNRRNDATVTVGAIAPESATQNAVVFAPLALAAGLERFQERGTDAVADDYAFPSFRLYARDITDVAILERLLLDQGLEVRTDVARIEWTLEIGRSLSALFAILTACAAAGVGVALAASLGANVLRKTRDLSLLRLLGVPPRRLAGFPLAQAVALAGAGTVLGALVALTVGVLINLAYGRGLLGEDTLCRLAPGDLLAALGASLALALLAGAAAARPVLRIAPAEGLRET